MDELVTDCATRPASSEHRFVPIETLLADPTIAGLNPEQHRLPFPATFSNTHKSRSIAGQSREKQASGDTRVRAENKTCRPCRLLDKTCVGHVALSHRTNQVSMVAIAAVSPWSVRNSTSRALPHGEYGSPSPRHRCSIPYRSQIVRQNHTLMLFDHRSASTGRRVERSPPCVAIGSDIIDGHSSWHRQGSADAHALRRQDA
jgi:hypothetical protein